MVSLVPVVVLGLVLMSLLTAESKARGVSEGRAKADLIAHTAIAPQLSGADLGHVLSPAVRAGLARSVDSAIRGQTVLRLRLWNLSGVLVFSGDRSGGGADEHALKAAAGQTTAEITYLNDDRNDRGPTGPRVVEVYQPLNALGTGARIGVLEVYLPYAPIVTDISHGQRQLLAALGAGLLLLWTCLMGVSASVTRTLRRQAAANAHLASHDTLTGLANRASFTRSIAEAATRNTDTMPFAIALLNLDRFRDVNDALGYANGDRLIQTVATRLSNQLHDSDVVARLGGDEFGIILTEPRDPASVEQTLHQLRAEVSKPLEINEIPLTVEAALGYTLASQESGDPASLLRQADIALSVSKIEHRGVVRYSPAQDTYDSAALILVSQLRQAISDGQLLLHYQPQCDLGSNTVTAVEALVRWQHPTRGLLYPDSFLAQVEQTELIDDLTRWLLRTVGATLPTLDPAGELSVAVNLSARSLIRADFADEVIAELATTNTDPAKIVLEITETAIMANPPRALQTLTRLHDAGLRISIDDFGAGQTSLGYLALMPITELKIDRALVMSMNTDDRNAAIVGSVIELGHSLGFSVIAEGVETAEVLRDLTELGCDLVQGYLLSRPVPLSDLNHRVVAANATLTALNRHGLRPMTVGSSGGR